MPLTQTARRTDSSHEPFPSSEPIACGRDARARRRQIGALPQQLPQQHRRVCGCQVPRVPIHLALKLAGSPARVPYKEPKVRLGRLACAWGGDGVASGRGAGSHRAEGVGADVRRQHRVSRHEKPRWLGRRGAACGRSGCGGRQGRLGRRHGRRVVRARAAAARGCVGHPVR
eukprot:scaffold20031_cov111-Isochrysis_galbana.AAC.5